MSVGVDDEAPRASDDPAFRDAVTFSFGDPLAQVYGLARIGVGGGGASGFAVVYVGHELAGSSAQSVTAAGSGSVAGAWEDVRAAGVRCSVVTPLEAWTVAYAGPDAGFDLSFEAVSATAVLDAEDPVSRVGGTEGYEQLCSVTGTVTAGGSPHSVRCLGQRGHLWGTPDWSRIELARTLTAWMGADRAVTLTALRPAKARHHDEETVAGFLIDGGEPLAIFDPRLSTTYDADQRQRRAGLELWMSEEGGYARRAAGEVVCGTTVELGELRLHSAFFSWRMEGREGAGRYDVLRRVGTARDRGTDGAGGGALRRR